MENKGKILYTRDKEEVKMINKILKSFLAVFLCLGLCFQATTIHAADDEKRAVWVSYLDFQTHLKDKSETEFKRAFQVICDNAKSNNLNTLIVHVRAFNDAVYPTANYPWADWISSDQKNPGYDPLEIMVDMTHDNGLEFEAWINPYRISLTTTQTQTFMNSSYSKGFAGEELIEYEAAGHTRMILNPASPNVQRSVVQGVEEIVRNYDVDGIHFDDYFYVTNTHGNTTQQERMDHVNTLVRNVYDTIKSIDSSVTFGISPAGNVANCMDHGVDLTTWLSKSGYVDYVMPQLYWTNQHDAAGQTTMFSNRANQFKALHTNSDVKLYVGLGLYNVVRKPAGDSGWVKSDQNLADQAKIAKSLGYEGYALFRYDDLLNSTAKAELNNLLGVKTTAFTWAKEGNTWYAYNKGEKIKGWVKDEFNCWYLLDFETGAMQTGWIAGDETHWYYLNPANGIMFTGLHTIDGEQYLLENTGQFAGSMLREGTHTVGGNTCNIAQNGVVIRC